MRTSTKGVLTGFGAALLLAASAATASADITFATGSSNLTQGKGGGPPLNQGVLDNDGNAPTIGNGAGRPDLLFINVTDIHTPESFSIDFAFQPLDSDNLIIWTGNYGNPLVFLTGVTWDGPAPGTIAFTPFGNAPLLNSAPAGEFLPNFISGGTIGWTLGFSNITLEFTGFGANGGSTANFTIDAISNPEPGTMALFGVGLLGVAAVVVRRRRTLVLQPAFTGARSPRGTAPVR